jgi:hypothetical protein
MPHRGDRRFGGALHALPAMAIVAALTALVCVLAFGGSEKPGNVGAGFASTSASAPTSSTAASTDLAAEKSSELASEAALRSAAALDPSPKDPDYVPTFDSQPPRQSGIVNMQSGPFSSDDFDVSNFWQGPDPSDPTQWYLVYAGADVSNGRPGIPAVRVWEEATDPNSSVVPHQIAQVTYPVGSGDLSIQSASATSLTCATPDSSSSPPPSGTSTSSDTVTFDLNTLTFSS